jgi:hypothetical protein
VAKRAPRSPVAFALLVAACRSDGEPAGAYVATAAQPAPLAVLAAAPAERDGAALERSLAAIQPLWISADIQFIASDELGGRATPSAGQRIAARYVRARLERLGFEPGAQEGFFHTYSLASRRVDVALVRAAFDAGAGEVELAFGRDFGLHPLEVVGGQWSAPVEDCGEGKGEELEAGDLRGKWALCREGGAMRRTRQRRAEQAGAVGLIVVRQDPEGSEAQFASWLERSSRSLPRWPGERAHEAEGGEDGGPAAFPTLWLDHAAGERLFEALRGAGAQGVRFTFSHVGAGEERLENVCGFWPGSDADLAREVLIVSAHYDHVGTSRTGEVFNGADDNASGTCGMLALAEALAEHGPLKRSVLLIWTSGEELGLFGSRAWAERPWVPEGCRPVANINIDMIGRNDPGRLEITPTRKLAKEFNRILLAAEELAPLEGFGPLVSCDQDWDRSDHAMFAEHLGIPVAFLSGGEHEDYHRPSDDADKIDSDKVARTARLVMRLLEALQSGPIALEPAEAVAPAGGGG